MNMEDAIKSVAEHYVKLDEPLMTYKQHMDNAARIFEQVAKGVQDGRYSKYLDEYYIEGARAALVYNLQYSRKRLIHDTEHALYSVNPLHYMARETKSRSKKCRELLDLLEEIADCLIAARQVLEK